MYKKSQSAAFKAQESAAGSEALSNGALWGAGGAALGGLGLGLSRWLTAPEDEDPKARRVGTIRQALLGALLGGGAGVAGAGAKYLLRDRTEPDNMVEAALKATGRKVVHHGLALGGGSYNAAREYRNGLGKNPQDLARVGKRTMGDDLYEKELHPTAVLVDNLRRGADQAEPRVLGMTTPAKWLARIGVKSLQPKGTSDYAYTGLPADPSDWSQIQTAVKNAPAEAALANAGEFLPPWYKPLLPAPNTAKDMRVSANAISKAMSRHIGAPSLGGAVVRTGGAFAAGEVAQRLIENSLGKDHSW